MIEERIREYLTPRVHETFADWFHLSGIKNDGRHVFDQICRPVWLKTLQSALLNIPCSPERG